MLLLLHTCAHPQLSSLFSHSSPSCAPLFAEPIPAFQRSGEPYKGEHDSPELVASRRAAVAATNGAGDPSLFRRRSRKKKQRGGDAAEAAGGKASSAAIKLHHELAATFVDPAPELPEGEPPSACHMCGAVCTRARCSEPGCHRMECDQHRRQLATCDPALPGLLDRRGDFTCRAQLLGGRCVSCSAFEAARLEEERRQQVREAADRAALHAASELLPAEGGEPPLLIVRAAPRISPSGTRLAAETQLGAVIDAPVGTHVAVVRCTCGDPAACTCSHLRFEGAGIDYLPPSPAAFQDLAGGVPALYAAACSGTTWADGADARSARAKLLCSGNAGRIDGGCRERRDAREEAVFTHTSTSGHVAPTRAAMVYAEPSGRLMRFGVSRNPKAPAFHLKPEDKVQLEGCVRGVGKQPAIAPALDACHGVSLRLLGRMLRRLQRVQLASGARVLVPWGEATIRHLEDTGAAPCDRDELALSPPAGQQSHRDCARMTKLRFPDAHAPSSMLAAAADATDATGPVKGGLTLSEYGVTLPLFTGEGRVRLALTDLARTMHETAPTPGGHLVHVATGLEALVSARMAREAAADACLAAGGREAQRAEQRQQQKSGHRVRRKDRGV